MSDVETTEYAKFCGRIIRSYARRVADADDADLADMMQILGDMEAAVVAAVQGMRDRGESWTYIGSGMGMTRQGASQWFKRHTEKGGRDE